MRLFDQLKIGNLYKGSDVRKFFPGSNSTFQVNFKIELLKRIIKYIEQNSFNNFIFVFTVTDKFLQGKSKKSSYAGKDLANNSKILVAFKSGKLMGRNDHIKDEEAIDEMGVRVPGFYRQGSYMSTDEMKRDWKLVHKKPGFRLKPETEKHFGNLLTGLNFNESYKSILKENMDYLDIGEVTKNEQEFVKMATEHLINEAYNNKSLNREGEVGVLLTMGSLFEKATGFRLPEPFIRKFFYVYPIASSINDGQNQREYVLKNYIDKYKLNLLLPQTGGFWVRSVANALIFKLIDHHKRKEIYSKVFPLIYRYFMFGLHELADIVVTDALYSKSEIEKLKNYFVRRKLKPETDKHFGDILTSL